MAHSLAVTGTLSLFIHPVNALHRRPVAVTSEDAVIAISKGGRSADSEPGGIVTMGSTPVVSAWSDAPAIATTEMCGCTWRDVLLLHPGGTVGRRAAQNPDS